MKRAVIDAKEFSVALSKISKVLKKCDIHILEEVCVRIQDGSCTLTATDLETWMTATIPAQGDELSFVFQKTKDIMKACSHFEGALTLELREQPEESKKSHQMLLQCAQRAAEFEVYSAEDYPVLPTLSESRSVQVDGTALYKCVERVRYAALKPSLSAKPSAICVQFCGDQVFALDGCRMSCDTMEGTAFPVPFLARADALAYLKVFGEGAVTVCIDDRRIRFTDGVLSLYVRRYGVDTFHPSTVVPKEYREVVTVKTAELMKELGYLKECSIMAAKPYVRFEGERLSVNAPNGHFATHVELSGRGDLVLGFDLHYMLDALKQFKGEPEVQMKLSGISSPIVIEAEGRGDFALVLPVRLRESMAA